MPSYHAGMLQCRQVHNAWLSRTQMPVTPAPYTMLAEAPAANPEPQICTIHNIVLPAIRRHTQTSLAPLCLQNPTVCAQQGILHVSDMPDGITTILWGLLSAKGGYEP